MDMTHANTNTTTSKPLGSSRLLDLTFGVELEFILAIHTPPSPAPAPSSINPFPTHHLPPSPLDPLSYLHDQFTHHNLPSTTSKFAKGIRHAYKTWLITTDGSLTLPSFEETAAALPGLVDGESAAARVEWDVQGIELVSPPLRVPEVGGDGAAYLQDAEGGVGSIKAYLDVLHEHMDSADLDPAPASSSHRRHAAFPTLSCGMHIHIGLAPNTSSNTSIPTPTTRFNNPLPLPLLRHLSHLLLLNEHHLSSLHHPSRTPYPGTQASTYAKSNRVSFRADGHAGCTRERVDWAEVHARVFEEEKEEIKGEGEGEGKGKWGMCLEKLCWMMGADEVVDREGRTEDMREEERREELEQQRNKGQDGSTEGGCDADRDPNDVSGVGVGVEGLSMSVRVSDWNGGADDYPWGPVDWNGPVAGEPTTSGIDAIGDTHPKNDPSSIPSSNADSWTRVSTSSTPSSPSTLSSTPTSTNPFPAPPTDPFRTDLFRRYNSPTPFPPGTKHKLTNYTPLARLPSEGPRTIEFRQPAGTLSLLEISETVRLYTALVREAERRADEDAACHRRVGDGVCVEPVGSLEEFLGMLRLSEEGRRYWIRRAGEREGEREMEAGEESRKQGKEGDCERCAVCREEFDRRGREGEEEG